MPATIEWTVVIEMDNGHKVTEIVGDEADANSTITALKNPSASTDGWLEFGGMHLRIDRIVVLRKRQIKKPE